MSDVNEIRKEIAAKYISMCEKISHEPNNSLARYLSNPVAKSFYLDLIFRGNDKLNFNSRLTDRDIILVTSAIEGYQNVLQLLFRLSAMSTSPIMSLPILECKYSQNAWSRAPLWSA